MVQAWFDTEAFLRAHPDEAIKTMSKVVGVKPADYKVFLPGTRFFNSADNLAAFDAAKPQSLQTAAPTIYKFLSENKLITGPVDYAVGLDASLLSDALKK
jgi:NitT/TauT family transport system substrate-binding protein